MSSFKKRIRETCVLPERTAPTQTLIRATEFFKDRDCFGDKPRLDEERLLIWGALELMGAGVYTPGYKRHKQDMGQNSALEDGTDIEIESYGVSHSLFVCLNESWRLWAAIIGIRMSQ